MPHSKPTLRATMHTLRQNIQSPNAANTLRDVFTLNVKLKPTTIIATYAPFRHEIDPTPLTNALRAQGHPIALPVIIAPNTPLIFRLHTPTTPLTPNAMGILEPPASAAIVTPDVLLVPLLAFDRQRNRLGYGGGYYDRTIATLRQTRALRVIGIAYAAQEIPLVPTTPTDIPMDIIVTEVNVF